MLASGQDYFWPILGGLMVSVAGALIVANGAVAGLLLAVPGAVVVEVALIAWAVDWGTQWLPRRIAWAIVAEQASIDEAEEVAD